MTWRAEDGATTVGGGGRLDATAATAEDIGAAPHRERIGGPPAFGGVPPGRQGELLVVAAECSVGPMCAEALPWCDHPGALERAPAARLAATGPGQSSMILAAPVCTG